MKSRIIALFFIILTAGCATKEKQEVLAQCGTVAMREYPPKIEKQWVNKTRLVSVPDGTSSCTTAVSGQVTKTNCTSGTKLESVPYTAVEDVDLNAQARDAMQDACASRTCVERYGNPQCKKTK